MRARTKIIRPGRASSTPAVASANAFSNDTRRNNSVPPDRRRYFGTLGRRFGLRTQSLRWSSLRDVGETNENRAFSVFRIRDSPSSPPPPSGVCKPMDENGPRTMPEYLVRTKNERTALRYSVTLGYFTRGRGSYDDCRVPSLKFSFLFFFSRILSARRQRAYETKYETPPGPSRVRKTCAGTRAVIAFVLN